MAPKADPKAKAKAESKAKAKSAAKKDGEEEKGDRVPQPDRAEYEAAVQAIQDAIDKFQQKQKALGAKIAERSGGKEEFFAQKTVLRGQLDEFSAKIDALMGKKNELNESIGAKKAEKAEMAANLSKMKKSIGFTSESDIDDRIATIEFKLWTDTISLKDEKKLLQEITELKRNRPKVSQVNKMEESVKGFDLKGDVKEQIAQINAEVSALRDGKKAVQEKMSELMEGRKSQLGDMPQLIDERDGISKQIQDKIKERNELRDAFREKEREYRKYQDELRAERQKKAMEEREIRNKEYDLVRRQRAADKLDEQPHIAEMTLIEQTMAFCKSLTSTKEEEKKEEKKDVTYDVPDGAEVMLKKEDRDEFWFAPTKAKGKKGKSGKKEGGSSSKPIKHNAETFKLFDQLKLDAPITTDDIPALMEKLEAQLEEYKEKVKVWEEKREEMKRKIIEEGFNPEKKEEATEEEKKEES
jgi:uncharacterized coiled-coil DUF342 family protein